MVVCHVALAQSWCPWFLEAVSCVSSRRGRGRNGNCTPRRWPSGTWIWVSSLTNWKKWDQEKGFTTKELGISPEEGPEIWHLILHLLKKIRSFIVVFIPVKRTGIFLKNSEAPGHMWNERKINFYLLGSLQSNLGSGRTASFGFLLLLLLLVFFPHFWLD